MEFITLFHFKNDIHSEAQIKVFKFIDKNFLVLEPPKSKKDLVYKIIPKSDNIGHIIFYNPQIIKNKF